MAEADPGIREVAVIGSGMMGSAIASHVVNISSE